MDKLINDDDWQDGKTAFQDELNNEPMVADALLFATAAHAAVGQVRKYSGKPYISHPIAVARILLSVIPGDVSKRQIMAALLHDVVEDTKITILMIQEHFGATVAGMVDDLSEPEYYLSGNSGPRHNRRTRKGFEIERWRACAPESKTVKSADLLANGYDIVAADPDFAKVYISEIAALRPSLAGAHPRMLALVDEMIVRAKAQLGLS